MARLHKLMLGVLFDSIKCEDDILYYKEKIFIGYHLSLNCESVVQVEDIVSILDIVIIFQGIV
jgi:hypothetical protein